MNHTHTDPHGAASTPSGEGPSLPATPAFAAWAQWLGGGWLAAQFRLSRLGAVACAALALLAAGLLAQVLLWRPPPADAALQDTLARQAAELSALRRDAHPPPGSSKPVRQATDWAQALGEGTQLEPHLQTLFRLAHADGLALQAGEYRWLASPGGETERYQVRLPVSGSYPAIRHFAEEVLAALPFASLDELALRRETVADPQLSATLQFSLHLHPGPAGRTEPGRAEARP